jgi:D-beta-D-heptose 7-phosphate kinase/D-beta-D-heptose 1-phosphate adenosyltransferase
LKQPESIEAKILSLKELAKKSQQWKAAGKKIAFTNGCFDLLHPGHIYSLSQAAKEADYLVVGLNADASVKKLKGENRPVNNEQSRALLLAALQMVDAIVIFDEETPLDLIKTLLPDVLVKGGDYTINEISGAKEVITAGGKIMLNPLLEGFSTTALIKKAASG